MGITTTGHADGAADVDYAKRGYLQFRCDSPGFTQVDIMWLIGTNLNWAKPRQWPSVALLLLLGPLSPPDGLPSNRPFAPGID